MTGSDMTEQDDRLLSQYLDGELSEAEEINLQCRLKTEPALRRQLAAMQAIDEHLRNSAEAAHLQAVPAHITALLEVTAKCSAKIHPFPSHRARTAIGFAIAASLIAAAGLLLAPQWQAEQQGLSAENSFATALETLPSSADQWHSIADGRQLRPVLSFMTTTGQWCREYQLNASGQTSHGIACRDDSGWHNEALVSAESQQLSAGNLYQPAGAAELDEISRFINQHAADNPLSAAEEASVIVKNWQ